ncbi:MAG: MFS transporter [Chloroflexi bacterium]|nr:MFS transporter [Chloroflexota bacterium]
MTAATAPVAAKSTRRERVAWYLYDFGNSAYAAVVLLAVYSRYFQNGVVGGAEGTKLWGTAVFIAMLVVAVSAPFLGAIADYSGAKKRFLIFFTTQACIFTGLLFFVIQGRVLAGMAFFILAEIGYRAAQVFYNGFLPEIAHPDDMGRVAGIGWAVGSAGGVLCLLIVLAMILASGSSNFMIRLSFIVTAVFFAVSALPLFFWLPERAERRALPPGENYASIAIKQLKETIRAARGFVEFLKFMLAFLVYNDGVIMALDFAAIIGGVLFGLTEQQLIILMILVQITNVVGAYVFGVMVDRFGGKRTLDISLVLMIIDVILIYFAQTVTHYFIIAIFAGFAMAGIQSVSRTMVGMFSPPGRSAEFYGFFALTGRTSSFIGPAVFGWLTAAATVFFMNRGQTIDLAEQMGHRIAALSIAAFLFAGLILLQFVNEKKAREAALAS